MHVSDLQPGREYDLTHARLGHLQRCRFIRFVEGNAGDPVLIEADVFHGDGSGREHKQRPEWERMLLRPSQIRGMDADHAPTVAPLRTRRPCSALARAALAAASGASGGAAVVLLERLFL